MALAVQAADRSATKAERRERYKQEKHKAEAVRLAELRKRLSESAVAILATKHEDKSLLRLEHLGSERPQCQEHDGHRPFCCSVHVEVHDLTRAQAVEQGSAIIREVETSFARGAVSVSARQATNSLSHVMWDNLGARSLRLDPSKSNRINWLDKSWAGRSLLDPHSAWASQRELLQRHLPHAQPWIDVLQHAYEDGGIDIKDDCRLDDRSALCHQDGGNAIVRQDGLKPLVRLALNVSGEHSGRSLDWLAMECEGRFVDGAERAALLICSVSQDRMWHGAAQTIHGYVAGVSAFCHSSSAGSGPCLKRVITVFELPDGHPLALLTAVQRLKRIGIVVRAVDERFSYTYSCQ